MSAKLGPEEFVKKYKKAQKKLKKAKPGEAVESEDLRFLK